MVIVKEIFNNLQGKWKVKRLLSGYGTAQGVAVFSLHGKQENYLHYREDITVKPTQIISPYIAYREYIYIYDPQTNNIIQKFIDNKLFCVLNFSISNNTAQGEHLCELDHYKATYQFTNENIFNVIYNVVGANKNYLIETEYTRL